MKPPPPKPPALQGSLVRLEPLHPTHVPALLRAIERSDDELYRWTTVPRGEAAMTAWVSAALAAASYATVRVEDDAVVGCTRLFDFDWWAWPVGHPRHGREYPDTGEIGYTWLSSDAIRSGINTEAKLLMLTLAFETWNMMRICLHTDERNARSRAAIERIGGQFEGILRGHRLGSDLTSRRSARYSITADDWPATKAAIESLLRR